MSKANDERFPTTLGQALNGPFAGEDHLFTLYYEHPYVTARGRKGHHLVATTDMPFAVRDKKWRDEIAAETGVFLPTREEIGKHCVPDSVRKSFPNEDFDRLLTLGTGLIIHITAADGITRVPILFNSDDKFINPGLGNFASGLSSEIDPIGTAKREAAEENVILVAMGDELIGINFLPPEELASSSDGDGYDYNALRGQQMPFIENQLTVRHPTHAGKPIRWQERRMKMRPTRHAEPMIIDLLDFRYELESPAFRDDKVNSFNMFPTVSLDLSDVAAENILVVDGESYGRRAMLCSFAEAGQQKLIPAPTDYFNKVSE